MEEQLPTPLSELLLFNLYLGSITYVVGIAVTVWIILRNGRLNWLKSISLIILLVILANAASIVLWSVVPWDLMMGPIHIPTLISIIILAPTLLKLFRYRLVTKRIST